MNAIRNRLAIIIFMLLLFVAPTIATSHGDSESTTPVPEEGPITDPSTIDFSAFPLDDYGRIQNWAMVSDAQYDDLDWAAVPHSAYYSIRWRTVPTDAYLLVTFESISITQYREIRWADVPREQYFAVRWDDMSASMMRDIPVTNYGDVEWGIVEGQAFDGVQISVIPNANMPDLLSNPNFQGRTGLYQQLTAEQITGNFGPLGTHLHHLDRDVLAGALRATFGEITLDPSGLQDSFIDAEGVLHSTPDGRAVPLSGYPDGTRFAVVQNNNIMVQLPSTTTALPPRLAEAVRDRDAGGELWLVFTNTQDVVLAEGVTINSGGGNLIFTDQGFPYMPVNSRVIVNSVVLSTTSDTTYLGLPGFPRAGGVHGEIVFGDTFTARCICSMIFAPGNDYLTVDLERNLVAMANHEGDTITIMPREGEPPLVTVESLITQEQRMEFPTAAIRERVLRETEEAIRRSYASASLGEDWELFNEIIERIEDADLDSIVTIPVPDESGEMHDVQVPARDFQHILLEVDGGSQSWWGGGGVTIYNDEHRYRFVAGVGLTSINPFAEGTPDNVAMEVRNPSSGFMYRDRPLSLVIANEQGRIRNRISLAEQDSVTFTNANGEYGAESRLDFSAPEELRSILDALSPSLTIEVDRPAEDLDPVMLYTLEQIIRTIPGDLPQLRIHFIGDSFDKSLNNRESTTLWSGLYDTGTNTLYMSQEADRGVMEHELGHYDQDVREHEPAYRQAIEGYIQAQGLSERQAEALRGRSAEILTAIGQVEYDLEDNQVRAIGRIFQEATGERPSSTDIRTMAEDAYASTSMGSMQPYPQIMDENQDELRRILPGSVRYFDIPGQSRYDRVSAQFELENEFLMVSNNPHETTRLINNLNDVLANPYSGEVVLGAREITVRNWNTHLQRRGQRLLLDGEGRIQRIGPLRSL